MADTGTPLIDSLESVPPPSGDESKAGLSTKESQAENAKDAEGGEGEAGDGEGMEVTNPPAGKGNFKPKNGCQACCGGIMSFFANDAIYGSFVGPHPVSFFCICKPCKKCVSPKWARPLCVASIATKTMNFMMLGVIALLSCSFIVPWPLPKKEVGKNDSDYYNIADFYSCKGKKVWNSRDNGGCIAHAGYFMVYRCFLAVAFVFLTNCFAMADVTSTTDDPYRKRIHHGFWMYKYLYLFVLLLLFFFFMNGNTDHLGYFEYTVTILGNIAHVLFSFMVFTVILDILEVWVASIALSNNGWANFMYSLVTCILFILDIILFIAVISHFAFELQFDDIQLRRKGAAFDNLVKEKKSLQDIVGTSLPPPLTLEDTAKNNTIIQKYISDSYVKPNLTDQWWLNNCLDGNYKPGFKADSIHAGLISAMAIAWVLLIVAMALKMRFSKRYPLQGWLQVAVIILFDLFYLWSALFNSEHVNSRPRCNWGLNLHADIINPDKTPQESLVKGTHDTYFRYTGFLHGMIILFTLMYFAFVHGPRTKSAPLSLAYRHFIAGGYDRVPVYPDPQNSPPEFKKAVEHLEVWDDETESVAQSWSLFYLMMMLGSLSLMMAMTNFTDPWAAARYNSSRPAMYFKFFTAMGVTLTYMCMVTCPCTRVYKAYEAPKKKLRLVQKPVQIEGQEEVQMEEPVVVEMYEEVDQVSLQEEGSITSEHQPNQCGCLF